MKAAWEITADWESLDRGGDEERACFAALGIRAHSIWLTEGNDAIVNRLRQAPYLSAYDLAARVRQLRSQVLVFARAHFQKCHYNSANCSGAAGFSIPNA